MIKIELNQELLEKEELLEPELMISISKEINKLIKNAPGGLINVATVTDDQIQGWNKEYRKKDEVTDVLAFAYEDDVSDEGALGDVVISTDQAKRQAEEGFRKEFVTLVVHGVLHVLGYDHIKNEDAEIMLPLQETILNAVL